MRSRDPWQRTRAPRLAVTAFSRSARSPHAPPLEAPIATGLLRTFAGLEEGSAYYLHNRAFWIKMALLGCILLPEVWPMTTLMRWRMRQARGQPLDTCAAPVVARISAVQTLLIMVMVFAATAMARGLGF